MTEQARTITLDGETHQVDKFSPGVQQAVVIYNTFQADLQKEQLAVMKTQGALQTVGAQIAEAVKKELAAKDEPAAELDADAADVVADTAAPAAE